MDGLWVEGEIQALLGRLASMELTDLFRRHKVKEGLLENLKELLLCFDAVLNDAQVKLKLVHYSSKLEDWLGELTHTLYRTEDLLDQISSEEKRRVRNLKLKTETIMEELFDRMDSLAKQRFELGLTAGKRYDMKLPSGSSEEEETPVIGRESDREAIIDLLFSACGEHLSVIPILGIGGIGKTTLAHLVYNDHRVDQHFDLKAWVSVSDPFNMFDTFRVTIEEFTSQPCHVKDLNLVQLILQKRVIGKRILVVLDDVWNLNYNDWEVLRTPFKDAAKGSCIILTTRNEMVASITHTVHTYYMEPLPLEECGSIFIKSAFGNEGSRSNPNLETIGKEIVRKCHGLPLAAKTLGGLLWSTPQVEKWVALLDPPLKMSGSLPASKPCNDQLLADVPKISDTLRISYNYLPSHLKRCFAYCSLFPRDYEFEKDKIVLLWMAEGLLQQHKGNRRTEEVGDEYFQDLLFRSFFQRSNGNKSCFMMHSLVNDLARSVSGEFCSRLEDNDALGHITVRTRYLALTGCNYDSSVILEAVTRAEFLRTFLPLNLPLDRQSPSLSSSVLWSLLSKLQFLRVLSLSHYHITVLPNSIGNLIHLRYLDLSHTAIMRLPQSICALCNLQTLILSNCHSLYTLPENICRLTSLRHLNLSGTALTRTGLTHGDTVDRENYRDIPEERVHPKKMVLPERIVLLQVLKVPDSSVSYKKLGIGDNALVLILDGLQVLSSFKIPTVSKILLLVQLSTGLQSLKIERCDTLKSICEGVMPCSLFLKQLDFVNPFTAGRRLTALKSLYIPSTLIRFCIWNCEKRIKEWSLPKTQSAGKSELLMTQTSFLGDETDALTTTLSSQDGLQDLSSFESMKVSEIPQLMNLPKRLHSLKIEGCHALEFIPQQVMTSPFLQHLYIINCCSLKSFGGGHLPTALKSLYIENCKKLNFLPSAGKTCQYALEDLCLGSSCDSLRSLSLGFFPKLKSLSIWDCVNLESLSVPDGIQKNLIYLEALEIRDCRNLVSFPKGGLPSPNLTSIWLSNCTNLKELPEQLHTLNSLESMFINNCPELVSLSERGLPSNPSSLCITFCEKLELGMEWGLHRLESLSRLEIEGGCKNVESFPEEKLLPRNLSFLRISRLLNLKYLDYRGLQHLTTLKTLEISYCNQLQSLPEEGLPSSLSILSIKECSLLKPKLQNKMGKAWSKISRISCIFVV